MNQVEKSNAIVIALLLVTILSLWFHFFFVDLHPPGRYVTIGTGLGVMDTRTGTVYLSGTVYTVTEGGLYEKPPWMPKSARPVEK